ncbi:NADH-quinone oxidoreductase subunit L [Butyricicoccus faecihominis]|uniref:NADH-quinone oxidoreductase subunit 5 family protein n=2 Tax=Butyricicoccaceae TaxID=3085642 RepID=UPI00247AD34F|nr:proton-conducting transporter membrane subunit [Butyricicoccus faecihominis]MCQ5131468.1 NADH-quinone oxidoreductase subunit L [Butyricicoccus faecihominis]
MAILGILVGFPLLTAFAMLFIRHDAARDRVVKVAAAITAILSVVVSVMYFKTMPTFFNIGSEVFSTVLLIAEIAMCVLIVYLCLRARRWFTALLSVAQTALIVWFELKHGHHVYAGFDLMIDKLGILMILIIGLVGSAITVYALGYMKDFQHHDKSLMDKRPVFFFVLYLFLAAMFGLVLSNNLMMMYFCWEITSFSSFLLIGYTGTKEAQKNSFCALSLNLLGGLAFAVAIVWLGLTQQLIGLRQIVGLTQSGIDVVVPTALLVFAGLTKAAQMPFSKWLLGAMVAPTPTSALLHSSTMVKAGVFLIIKLSPALGDSPAGLLAMMTGGVTFLFASFAAISQSNGKKVLAYSTISNLGLIVCCAGIGTFEAAWTAIMLVIFHAVAKSLMFLSVGTAEHHVGSRDIEDFDGLFGEMPQLAVCMSIGICGMFLAPFGMLISKWAAMKAFIDSGHAMLMLILVFGSSATFFFWTKWLGKVTAIVAGKRSIERTVHKEEWFVLKGLAAVTVLVCVGFPIIAKNLVADYLVIHFARVPGEVISQGNMLIMSFMVVLLVVLPLLAFGRSNKKLVHVNLAGENMGDDLTFRGSMDIPVPVSLRNWYMETLFSERWMLLGGSIVNIVIIILSFSELLGGVLHV